MAFPPRRKRTIEFRNAPAADESFWTGAPFRAVKIVRQATGILVRTQQKNEAKRRGHCEWPGARHELKQEQGD